MHWATIVAAIAAAQLGFCSGENQLPLSSVRHPESSAAQHDDSAPSYRDEVVSLHKSLVSASSTFGTEKKVATLIVDYLKERGYHVDRQYVPHRDDIPEEQDDRFNIIAWLGDRKTNYKVLVTSHIDTVPPHIPYQIDEGDLTKDTIIKGRGTVDAKGSVAAQMVAVERLRKEKNVNVEDAMLLFVVGEEGPGDGMRFFSDSLKHMEPKLSFDSAIFGEPTENKLACGHKGGLFCSIRAKGVDGHSGYPEFAKSANEIMVRALAKMIDADLGTSKLFGNTTVNIGRFDGGVAANVIAADAFVRLAVRVATGSEDQGDKIVQAKIQDILDGVDKEAFTFICTHGYGPYECNCDVDGE